LGEVDSGERIRALRAGLGLTQIELADLLGVSNVTVNRWERGRSEPQAAMRARLLRAETDGLRAFRDESLPSALASELIGRNVDLARLNALARPGRLVTISGAAGIGKTRLTAELVRIAGPRYSGGVVVVDLAPLCESDDVALAVVRALKLRVSAKTPVLDAVVAAVRERELLIVLDNCEHLLAACADLVDRLFAEPCSSTVLATSRIALAVAGEIVYCLPPLAPPDAERLFRARARQTSGARDGGIAAICRRLDCLPLAIELAAARTNILTTGQIAERLDRRLDLLPTLDAAIALSSDLLAPDEAALFRQLGVFAGWFDLAAVEGVAGERGAVELLGRLAAQSMIVVEHDDARGAVRYRLLESLAEHARRWWARCNEEETTRRRHANYFRDLAIAASPGLNGPDQFAVFAMLDDVHDNLIVALDWFIAVGDAESALAQAAALARYWRGRSLFVEGGAMLERALALPGVESAGSYIAALNGLGLLRLLSGRLDGGESILEQALTRARTRGDRAGEGRALDNLGLVYRGRGGLARAAGVHQIALDLFLGMGDRRAAGSCRLNLALIANQAGNLDAAKQGCHEAWSLLRGLNDLWSEAAILSNIGEIAGRQGNVKEARDYFDRAVSIFRRLGDPERLAIIATNTVEIKIMLGEFSDAEPLIEEAVGFFRSSHNTVQLAGTVYLEGTVAAGLGRPRAALALFRESLRLYHSLDDWADAVYALLAIVRIIAEYGDSQVAARLWGGMESIRERERVPDYASLDYQGALAAVRAVSGREDRNQQYAIGYAMPAVSVIADAMHLGSAPEHGVPTLIYRLASSSLPAAGDAEQLTPRQLEILKLVAAGQSNREIARRLGISPRTVERHLTMILAFFNTDRRSAAVAMAAATGLL
jgi:predicted ATPase/DNA-binding CsgD family transcriptional regulator/DNA-binding XRE family transcriptional regulator